jgi:hypothetical protein
MKENRKVYGILLALSLMAGAYVVVYFWMDASLERMRALPMDVIVALFVYIFMQIVKRQWFTRRNWWDWLYYLGLLAVVLPTYLVTEENASLFSWGAQIGTLCLLIPAILDGKSLISDGK